MENGYLVLTAAAGVPDEVVKKVGDALAEPAPAPHRLGGRSVEIPVPAGADPARQIELARSLAVDCNFVSGVRRKKSVLIADMDSTIVPVECIDELADFAGLREEVAAITEQAMRGDIGFEGALRARVRLLEGLPTSAMARCFEERISLNPGARELVRTMAAAGATAALVSGGFTYFTERVARAAGFAINQANRLIVADGRLTGEVAEPILGRAAKLAALRRLCRDRDVGFDEALAVGDGANDLAMIETAGLGVAFRAKPALRARAAAVLDHSDLTALLALQGYSEAEYSD